MSHSRRFLPLIIFGVIGFAIIGLASFQLDDAKSEARTCQGAATCGMAQGDLANAILDGVFGTTLIMIGGFISVLVGQRDRGPLAGAPLPQQGGATPPPPAPPGGAPYYGPPRPRS